jgi:hypothetical protein
MLNVLAPAESEGHIIFLYPISLATGDGDRGAEPWSLPFLAVSSLPFSRQRI